MNFRRTAYLALLVPLLVFAVPTNAQTAPDPPTSPTPPTTPEVAQTTGADHASIGQTAQAAENVTEAQPATADGASATDEQNVERSRTHFVPSSVMRAMERIDNMPANRFYGGMLAIAFAISAGLLLFSKRGGDEDDDNARKREILARPHLYRLRSGLLPQRFALSGA